MSSVHPLGRLVSVCGAALVAAVGLAACGGGVFNAVVARVGHTAIMKTTLDRSMAAMAPEHLVPDPPGYKACVAHQEAFAPTGLRAEIREECMRQYQALKLRALDHLIASDWVIAEAREQGLGVASEELASAKLRQRALEGQRNVSPAQVAAYYRSHKQRFLIPERWYFDIDELRSEAAAMKVRREVEAGKSFAGMAIHESIERPSRVQYGHEESVARAVIFAAKRNVLTGPVKLFGYSVFEVRRIVAASYLPLAKVQGAIETQLASEQQRRVLAPLVAAWRAKWIARTYCYPGYVVQKCTQYQGAEAPEDPLAFD